MRIRTWLPVLLTTSSLALSACGDDAPVTPGDESGSSGESSGGIDPTLDPDSTGDTSMDTTGPVVGCGDGTLQAGELCDDGNSEDGDGCSMACEIEEGYLCNGQPSECMVVCGDGLVVGDEECDDDNVLAGDGCSIGCEIEAGYACEGMPSVCAAVCGDGMVIDGMEGCDDGNTADGDGCGAACTVEEGYACDDEPSTCAAVCGDGLILGGEECDDFNIVADDGCSASCMVELGWACGMEPSVCTTDCGDGITAGMETCDDAGLVDGDGCSAACQVESGWICMGDPSVCDTECGDGFIAGPEVCDDGDVVSGDGCSDTCMPEPGYTCQGEPSDCITNCGDGVQVGVETCDDGNISQGDGCSLTCQAEFGWSCAGTPSVCTLTEMLDRVRLGIDTGCVLTTLGELGCFGLNSQGEVGIGFEDQEVQIPAFVLDDVIAFDSGEEFNCAVRVGGTVWCWGDNTEEQLGPNATDNVDEHLPIEVTGMPALVDIALGDDHACGLDAMGGVWCWGDSLHQQLGHGTGSTIDEPTPMQVMLPGGLVAIGLGLGDDHSCAVLSDNTVACWGDDDNGQLGNDTPNADSDTPVVALGLVAAADVQGGDDHTCARDDLGQMWCWGDNDNGQLGQGSTVDSGVPLLVPLPAAVDDITLGDNFTCALLVNDEIHCFGEGLDFQLASGDLVDVLSPQPILFPPPGDVVDIEAGGRGVCAVTSTAERYCWGYSDNGILGVAPATQVEPDAPTFSGPVQELVLSPFELAGIICGVMGDNSIECAGEGTLVSTSSTSGAAGLFGSIAYHLATPTPMAVGNDVQQLEIGDSFACFATSVDVQCWGDNSNRQLGQGGTSTTDILTPVPVMGLGAVDQLAVGDQFACVRTGGSVQCWGDNQSYQVGEPAVTTDQSLPVTVPGLLDAVDIDLGEDHACALRATGVVSCWGDDSNGQLGDDDADINDSAIPVDVAGLPAVVDQLAVGYDHACALGAGEVYCWGEGSFGALGQGNELDSDIAVLVPGLAGMVEVFAGYNYSCALDALGDLYCWGNSDYGNLGDGGIEFTGLTEVHDPIPFMVASGITDVRVAYSSTCVQTAAGWGCVGSRASGQLGNGSSVEPAIPIPMMFGL